MSKIWGFGTAAIDIRIKTAEYGDTYKDKLLAQEIEWFGGGSTSNFLVQVSRLGGKAGWLGKLGNDAIGHAIETMLRSECVDCSAVVRDSEVISPFNLAVYAGDARRRIGGFLLPNCMKDVTKADIETFIDAIDAKDWVLVEVGEIPLTTCIAFSELVKAKGAYIVIDVDLDPIKQCGETREVAETLFSLCDVLMPNVNALATLYGDIESKELAQMLYTRYGCRVVLSLGAEGASYMEGDGVYRQIAAIPVQVVDTVGAGDAFHGGVVYGLSTGLSLERTVVLGNICGAHNCKTFGARNGMIKASELKEYGFKDL